MYVYLCARYNNMNFVNLMVFPDIVYFVDQAGAGTWGIPAASPLRRGLGFRV